MGWFIQIKSSCRSLSLARYGRRCFLGAIALTLSFCLVWSNNAIAAPSAIDLSPKQLALQFAQEGWGTQPDWERAWDKLMQPNVRYHFNSAPDTIVGLDANKEFNAELFEGFPNIHQTLEDIVAEGDTVIYRTTLEGTNTGPFLGQAATGQNVKVNDFTLLRFRNGKISEWWYETNLQAVIEQLGLA